MKLFLLLTYVAAAFAVPTTPIVEHEGSCPQLPIAICIGDTCETDDRCGQKEKCCPTSCGSKVCIAAIPPEDVQSITDNTPEGDINNAKHVAHEHEGTCPPIPIAICIGDTCETDDRCGQMEKCCPTSCGSRVCIVALPPEHVQSITDSTPERDINNAKHVAHDQPRPGKCPLPDDITGDCSESNCQSDSTCGTNEKCCMTRCNNKMCVAAVTRPEDQSRPGKCPLPDDITEDCSESNCESDSTCGTNERCCMTRCNNKMCVPVVTRPSIDFIQQEQLRHTGDCPLPTEITVDCSASGSASICQADSMCAPKEKCCLTTCKKDMCVPAVPRQSVNLVRRPADQPRPGKCPLPDDITGDCSESNCQSDSTCGTNEKCCMTRCNNKMCVAAVTRPEDQPRPGKCPLPDDITGDCSESNCQSDSVCGTNEKCCMTRCNNKMCVAAVTRPEDQPRPGKCPLPDDITGDCSESNCQSDSTCGTNEKCCMTRCNNRMCVAAVTRPEDQPRPGKCPLPDDITGDCSESNCQSDSTCGTNEKCCMTRCNNKMCVAAVTRPEGILKEDRRLKRQPFPDPRPEQIIEESEDRIRWCVPSVCELKKCQRMVNEFTYNLTPRKDWRCIQAESKEQCLYWVSRRLADVAVTRVDDVYTAVKKYKLKPIVYEAPVVKGSESQALNIWESITLAITRRDNTEINRWSDIQGKPSCHAGIQQTFSFKAPVCSLISKEIIPKRGDYIESASHFFSESCVPGILDRKYNIKGTYPLNLCEACAKNSGRCSMTEDRYAGIEGSLTCLSESKGQVAFVDRTFLEKIIADGRASNYKVICEDQSTDLDQQSTTWKTNKACQLAVTPRPTVVVNSQKSTTYISNVIDLMTKAAKIYGKKSVSSFKLFESVSYKCLVKDKEGVYENDIIFRDTKGDETREIVTITDDKPFADEFFREFSSCMNLDPKPSAKWCVVTQAALDKCIEMKTNFDKTDKVNDIAWGCEKLPSTMECMKAVLNGTADLYSTDPTETFIAGHEFKHQPILSQYFDTLTTPLYTDTTNKSFDETTYTYTIGIMKKDRFYDLYGSDARHVKSLRNLNTCHAGMKKLSSFHHPIGWLLANGTIPRIGSIFESVNRYFDLSCLPGSDPSIWRLDTDLLMGHELNWGFNSLYFYNFTGFQWFIWNSPATWNYYNWDRQTPCTLQSLLLDNIEKQSGLSGIGKTHIHQDDLDWQMLKDIVGLPDDITHVQGLDDQITNSGPPGAPRKNSRVNDIQKHNENGVKIGRLRSNILSYALQMRYERMEQLGEVMKFLHNVPTVPDIRNRNSDWMNHPSVQSYLEIYYPNMIGYYSGLFEDAEIRKREFNRYTNPIWLSTKYSNYVDVMKTHQREMCHSCIGYGPKKCVEDTTAEPYFDYIGSLACLEEKAGDIAFFEAHKFQELLNADGQKRPEEYVLVCPTGEVVLYQNEVSIIEKCNFGRVPYPAIVTSHIKTGSWRWNVTKALLSAQEIFNVQLRRSDPAQFSMFGENSVFDRSTTELRPINLLHQTHQTFLGPMLLHSMEAIIKPSNFDWWKEDSKKCYGETYTNILTEKDGTCNAIVKNVTCVGSPPTKTVSVGRYGKKTEVTVEMCSRPTKHIRKVAEFTCENGDGYMKPVTVAVSCECVPCNELTYSPTWNKDHFWKTDAKLYHRNKVSNKESDYDLWGNKLQGKATL
ncbi:major yolk protein-like isoform X2 [Anneissia japonica]|uniref:major yolk protein-like isoform X2 n=1 Tax=Anneissia japonica TaxID=1529436 RepID=UPI001425AA0D|nr:major yolk protein-like isoform X2 [Anneissia japonica]